MTEPLLPVYPEPPSPPSESAPKRRRTKLVAGVAVIVLTLIGGGAYFALRGPRPFTASGTITVQDLTNCSDVAGFSEGMQVTITDPAGTIVALGHLGSPSAAANTATTDFDGRQVPVGGSLCTFRFAVSKVPPGKVSYGVAIGQHQPYQATEAELRSSLKLAPNN